MPCNILWIFSEQNNIDTFPGETVKLVTELPEEAVDVIWMKDSFVLCFTPCQLFCHL